MILTSVAESELKIEGYVNLSCKFLSVDSYTRCFNKQFFKSFPYQVNYQFNSLGYRELPVDQYQQDAILIIGDSAITGLGLPFELTVAKQLEQLCGHQVLNFSMCGASNDWIARKLEIILKYFDPRAVFVHYTFSHRRENPRSDWYDNERTLCDPIPTLDENYKNWFTNHYKISTILKKIPSYYSFIPMWHTDEIDYHNMLAPVAVIDFARDSFHYGPKTSHNLARTFNEQYTTNLLVRG